jgi:predicted transcriptional regulator
MCLEICKRWWIHRAELASKAGITQALLAKWQRGRIASATFEPRGAVYDALLDLVERQAIWAVKDMARLKEAHRGK